MSILDSFLRCTKSRPCPVCGKPDWCLAARDGSAAVCQRVESRHRWREAGWFHRLVDCPQCFPVAPRLARTRFEYKRTESWVDATNRYRAALNGTVGNLADLVGLPESALNTLGVGWSPEHTAWSFPMYSGTECRTTVGIRLRSESGRKWSVTGSKQGLIVPEVWHGDGPVLVVEGPTDCAAAVSLGFDAIGRPSCLGCEAETVTACRGRVAWIIADNDGPGIGGAVKLAAAMKGKRKIVMPGGYKDLRAWVNAGATADDVRDAASSSA